MTAAHRAVKAGNTRLAIRTEGGRVIAYLTPPDSMEGALMISTLHRGALDQVLREDWRMALELWLERVMAEVTPAGGMFPPVVAEELPDA